MRFSGLPLANPGAPGASREETGEIVAYYAEAYLGQVAVRQVRGHERYDAETDGFPDFVERVLDLAP